MMFPNILIILFWTLYGTCHIEDRLINLILRVDPFDELLILKLGEILSPRPIAIA
jgi:hypothetical protein